MILTYGMLLLGIAFIHIQCLSIYFTNVAFDPFKWNSIQNSFWELGSKFHFLVGVSIFYLLVLFDKLPLLYYVFGNYVWARLS